MEPKRILSLVQMRAGQKGTVVQIMGGWGATRRLEALGLRMGVRITKISAMIMRGPVTVQAGRTRVAIGFGMASKVMVEIE